MVRTFLDVDQVHPAAEQARQNQNIQMVHALRVVGEDQAPVGNSPDDRDEELQRNQLPGSTHP